MVKKFNGFQLKMFMIILMLLDHISYIPGVISSTWKLVIHAASRCVGVWFAYMAVEGILYTRNRMKYNLRLFISAMIMFVGNICLNFLFKSKEVYIYNNIFLTLSVGVLSINIFCFEAKGIFKFLKLVLVFLVAFLGLISTEGGQIIIPFMLITYFLRDREMIRNISYVIFSILMLIFSYVSYDSFKETLLMLLYNSDWLFILVIPFIYLYNGERGNNSKLSKYFFYVFYPLHLWIIKLIEFLVI